MSNEYVYEAQPSKSIIKVKARGQVLAVKEAIKKLSAADKETCNRLTLISINGYLAMPN